MARFKCRYVGCKKNGLNFYCSTHQASLRKNIIENVEAIYKQASAIYIGRSHFPEQRLLQHLAAKGMDRLSILHWTMSKEEAAEIEAGLIAFFEKRAKTLNIDNESSGKWAGNFNSIYVLWKEKNQSSWLGKDQILDLYFVDGIYEFDPSNRIWPQQAGIFEPVHLYCDISTLKSINGVIPIRLG